MVIKALTPSSKPTKVREMIVNILTTDFPLSIKKLKLLLKKNYNKSVSYQAIHKEINNLIDDKIAIKKDQKFQLSTQWLQEVRFSTDLVLSNYSSKKRNSILRLLDLKKDGDTVSFEFSSYSEIDAFFLELFDYYSDLFPQKNTVLMHYSNNWWPLLYPMEERRIFSKIKADVYGITALKFTLNKWCCEYEKSIGINVHYTPTKDGIQWTHNIFGDLLFNIYLDENINKKIVEFFNKNRDFRGINLRELIEIIHEQGNFKLVVIKDTAFTKSVLETELKLFKNS